MGHSWWGALDIPGAAAGEADNAGFRVTTRISPTWTFAAGVGGFAVSADAVVAFAAGSAVAGMCTLLLHLGQLACLPASVSPTRSRWHKRALNVDRHCYLSPRGNGHDEDKQYEQQGPDHRGDRHDAAIRQNFRWACQNLFELDDSP